MDMMGQLVTKADYIEEQRVQVKTIIDDARKGEED